MVGDNLKLVSGLGTMMSDVVSHVLGWEFIEWSRVPQWVKKVARQGKDAEYTGSHYAYRVKWIQKEQIYYNGGEQGPRCVRMQWIASVKRRKITKVESKIAHRSMKKAPIHLKTSSIQCFSKTAGTSKDSVLYPNQGEWYGGDYKSRGQ